VDGPWMGTGRCAFFLFFFDNVFLNPTKMNQSPISLPIHDSKINLVRLILCFTDRLVAADCLRLCSRSLVLSQTSSKYS
jgi:hypothetical protein